MGKKTGPKPSQRRTAEIATPPAFTPLDEWRSVEMAALADLALAPLAGAVAVKIAAGAPERPASVNCMVKPLLALLAADGVLSAAARVVNVVAGWDRRIPVGRVRVELWTTSDPRKRQTAAGRRRIGEAAARRAQPTLGVGAPIGMSITGSSAR